MCPCVIIYLFQGNRKEKLNVCAVMRRQEGELSMTTEKFCVKCGKKFQAIGREVICPECKAAAAEDAKRAAVLKAKRASWTGESVPVRISGRASTVIRRYGAEKSLPFAQALDALLQASPFFISTGTAWEEVEPYKSRRRDKSTTETAGKQDAPQVAGKPQEASQTAQAAKTSVKQAASKAAKTVKTAGKKVEK